MKTTQSQLATLLPIAILILLASLALSCSKEVSTAPTPSPQVASTSSGYVDINSVKLYYEITGEGEPLLLLHGGLGGSEHFEAVLPDLSKAFKVITVDRRGHGRSHDNAEPYSYAGMADEMNAVLDHFEMDSVSIIGFSDGGVVGYHLASTYPEKVRKLVAVGANYRVDGLTPETIEWTKNRLNPENLMIDFPDLEPRYRATNPQPDNFPAFLERSTALWLGDPYLTKEQMMAIQASVLFFVGENDAIRLDHVLEMKTLVKDSHLCVLPGASHFVLMEKPEVALPVIMGFLGE